jgi:pimeloyl-ACP methyl ester carboxylesterase
MDLHFSEFGSAQAPPLVILHGFLGSSDNWHTLARRFGDAFHVFVPDARNHGRSPHQEEFSYAVMSEDVRGFLQTRGLESAAIIGHSMGGRTAMELATRHPETVSALIVVDIATRAYAPHHEEFFRSLLEVDLTTVKDRSEVESVLARRVTSAAVRQFLMKNLHRRGDGSLHWKMNLPVLERRYSEVLSGLSADAVFNKPALFVRGGRSDYIQTSDLPEIRDHFPGAEFATIDAGHWVHAERPEEFFAAASEFLMKSSI